MISVLHIGLAKLVLRVHRDDDGLMMALQDFVPRTRDQSTLFLTLPAS